MRASLAAHSSRVHDAIRKSLPSRSLVQAADKLKRSMEQADDPKHKAGLQKAHEQYRGMLRMMQREL